MLSRFEQLILGCAVTVVLSVDHRVADAKVPDDSRVFVSELRPLLRQYCFDCHSGDVIEADLDLSSFAAISDVRQQLPAWLKIREMLDSRQMPPKESLQPTDAEREFLATWVRRFLAGEAHARAGDPGPVLLRRLNNEEYNYTIRDLTGVATLDLTHEFPVDGAAGEGFINAGAGQAMSSSMVQKYLDAAKEVADHLVLLPDGITFSPHRTRRDQTDAYMARIQSFYRRFTADGGGQAVSLQGIQFDTNQGGLLPLRRYLQTTLEERDALFVNSKSVASVARERGLSPKYLKALWRTLTASGDARSFLLDDVRRRWRQSTSAHVDQLAAHISAVQNTLWKFNSVGHVGDDGQPRKWIEPASPVVTGRDFSLPLPDSQQDVTITLAAADAGEQIAINDVVWQNPRLTGAGAEIPLSHLAGLSERIHAVHQRELARTALYLAAADEVAADRYDLEMKLNNISVRHNLDVEVLRSWLDFLQISESGTVSVTGHFSEQYISPDYRFISGWGTPETPLILSNSSDNEVRIPGLARPHSIMVHPSPTQFAAIGWTSPLTGWVTVEARMSDAHPECGNGQEWMVRRQNTSGIENLDAGEFGSGGTAELTGKTLSVRRGELISLIIGPKDASHACDLTEVSLVISEQDGEKRTWDLAKDVSADIRNSNPHADSHGNIRTWHFYHGLMEEDDRGDSQPQSIPPDSVLGRWRDEQDSDHRRELAQEVQALVSADVPADPRCPDAVLHRQIRELTSPLNRLAQLLADVDPDARFGKRPDGRATLPGDLTVRVPGAVRFTVPAQLARGRTFVTHGRLDPASVSSGSVRIEAAITSLTVDTIPVSVPVVVSETGHAKSHVQAAFDDFRELFAPALCYARIVPVDEVVTMTLFYRQDDILRRLMLNDKQASELDRLWDELLYVSQEPLKYQVAFEQIREFATQDRPDLVEKLAPLVKSVNTRAEAFKQRLRETESAHLDAVVQLADWAWRRPLSETERFAVRGLYAELHEAELPHDAAVRLTLVRVLTSPSFLYRREQPGDGAHTVPVTATELATRLSYFLWSSMPDTALRRVAARGDLTRGENLLQETRRMLADLRTRRLAIQFACQWLHLRDFDENDDKNESLYPQFADLRSDMYEETVLFFEDMFRNNGSVLSLIDADHTFLNESMARHYGIDGISGREWRRVDNIRSQQRGGLLTMATFLSSQSGASRTSPILRGNWVFETLLGEALPKPPATVPQLPETVPDGLTSRQLIERHSAVSECAKCHVRIDPYGFALEQFDAIGRLRPEPMDTKTTLVDGHTIDGIDGLRTYLLEQRREDVVRQFCHKLLGFALGREIQLSDEPLIDTMMNRLAADEFRFHTAVESVVLSRQFRKIRGVGAAE